MTLREELYRIAAKATGTKIDEESLNTHERIVDKHMTEICKKEAEKGNFSIPISSIKFCKLSDGTTLSKRDILFFARRNDLDYNHDLDPNPTLRFEFIK